MDSVIFEGKLATIILVCFFLLLLITEFISPLRLRRHPYGRRFLTNLCLTALAFLVGSLVVKPVALFIAGRNAASPIGFLAILPLPFPVTFAIGFILMDLTFYYWHRANHLVPILWRFHNVHHVDPDLDVTTSFRFHFGEILYSSVFRMLQIGLLGITPLLYLTYELFFQAATIFHHSNLRIPIGFERLLNKVVVTPRMHSIHHSVVGRETNSNYSVIFRWWDLLNRSLRLNIMQSDITIGVAGYSRPGDNGAWRLCLMPFERQRNYWRLPDGTVPKRKREPGGENPHLLLQ